MKNKFEDVNLSKLSRKSIESAGYTHDRWFGAWNYLVKRKPSEFILVDRHEDPEDWFESGEAELIHISDIKKFYIFYPVFSIAVCLKNGTQFYINTPHGTLSEAKYAMMCLAEIVN